MNNKSKYSNIILHQNMQKLIKFLMNLKKDSTRIRLFHLIEMPHIFPIFLEFIRQNSLKPLQTLTFKCPIFSSYPLRITMKATESQKPQNHKRKPKTLLKQVIFKRALKELQNHKLNKIKHLALLNSSI
jgi:hypothetical protein